MTTPSKNLKPLVAPNKTVAKKKIRGHEQEGIKVSPDKISPSGTSEAPESWAERNAKHDAFLAGRPQRKRELNAFLAKAPFTPRQKFDFRYRNPFENARDFEVFIERTHEINAQLDTLREGVLGGELNALSELMMLATESTRILNELAETAADFIEVKASENLEWPVLVNESTAREWQKKVVKKIKLGQHKPLVGYAPTLMHSESPATIWAGKLLLFMQYVRDVSRKTRPGGLGWSYDDVFFEQVKPLRVSLVFGFSNSKGEKQADHPVKDKILSLQEFSSATVLDWWHVAKEILHLHSNGRPWEDPDLKKLWPDAPQDSKLRSKIYDRVRRSFLKSEN